MKFSPANVAAYGIEFPDPKNYSDAMEALKDVAAWRSCLKQLQDEHPGYKCAAFDALSSCISRAEQTVRELEK